MATTRRKKTLTRQMPKSRFPVSRELAELANVLKSARLHAITEKVATLERHSNALIAMQEATGRAIAENGEAAS
jgi:hypothetical protein